VEALLQVSDQCGDEIHIRDLALRRAEAPPEPSFQVWGLPMKRPGRDGSGGVPSGNTARKPSRSVNAMTASAARRVRRWAVWSEDPTGAVTGDDNDGCWPALDLRWIVASLGPTRRSFRGEREWCLQLVRHALLLGRQVALVVG
jgi:hypothetical protein